MLERYYFIVNPVSGSGRAKRQFLEVKALLDAKQVNYGFDFTEYRGHAVELAGAALARGERCIVACGGDGTAQEVCSVLVNTGVVFGLLPFGTGNDFSRALRLPTDPEAALAVVLAGHTASADAATANSRVFVNVAGFGFDVDVVKYTEKYKRRFNGMLPYMLGIFQSLMHLRPTDVHIEADDEAFDERVLLINACNGTHFAGGLNLAPLASAADGLLDVCVLRALSVPAFLWLLPRYMKGKHLDSPSIRYFKAKQIRVSCDAAQTLDMDGELGECTPATFKILEGALCALTPEDSVL